MTAYVVTAGLVFGGLYVGGRRLWGRLGAWLLVSSVGNGWVARVDRWVGEARE